MWFYGELFVVCVQQDIWENAKERIIGMQGKPKKTGAMLNMTEGSPVRLLIVFAIPMMIGNIFQQLYNVVDSAIVGRLVGADALAAVGATGSVTFMFFALCNGIGSGGGIVTSQYFGSGEHSQVKKCIANVAYIMIVFPVFVGVVAYFATPALLKLLETPPEVLDDAILYMRMMCIGLPFVSLYNYVASMLRAMGDSKTPLYFLIFSSILNTILDYVFVKFCGLAVFGAALATLISQLASGVLGLIYACISNPYFKLKREYDAGLCDCETCCANRNSSFAAIFPDSNFLYGTSACR